MKYKKKPVIVEAQQWGDSINISHEFHQQVKDAHQTKDGSIFKEPQHVIDFDGRNHSSTKVLHTSKPIKAIRTTKTIETWQEVKDGDWIVKGVDGEFYSYSPEAFEANYERAE